MSKALALMLFTLLVFSSLAIGGCAFAQSIPKPSIPEFSLELVGPPYYQNTTYSLDPSTGQVVAEVGYTNPYSMLKIDVKNQPFDSSYGNLYYNVRVKNHSVTADWVEVYQAWNSYPQQSNYSDYTNVGFSIESYSSRLTLAGCQVDIQVEAMLGTIGRVSTSPPIGGYDFIGETSGWSESQTISIPANTPLQPTPTSSPSQENLLTQEQSVILGLTVTVVVLSAGLGLLLYLIKRK